MCRKLAKSAFFKDSLSLLFPYALEKVLRVDLGLGLGLIMRSSCAACAGPGQSPFLPPSVVRSGRPMRKFMAVTPSQGIHSEPGSDGPELASRVACR
mgnify:CR=1 FL=1